jgi:NodT family efflux transporter outer membrane factor (OMF) lipoprotein
MLPPRAGLLLALAVLAAGCAPLAPLPPSPPRDDAHAPPAVAPRLDLPAHWAGGAAPRAEAEPPAAAGDAWWQGFGAALTAVVDEALANNLDLRSAAANLQRARALRALAAASRQPTLGLGASAGRSRNEAGRSNSLRVGLDASWEADLFGANAAARAAAEADLDTAAAALRAARLAVAAEAGLAYLQWQDARAQRAATARSLQSLQQTLALVQLRERAGLAGGLEVEQARSAVLTLQAKAAALQDAQAQAAHALAVLSGRSASAAGPWLDALAPAPTGAGEDAEASLALPEVPPLPAPAALLLRRWDLQAAQHRIAAQLATLAQRQAERRPSFHISGNLALQAASLSALGGGGALLAGLAAAIDWPLFDGGAGQARVDAQRAALEDARIAWTAAVLAATRDVEDALSALASAREREHTLQAAARSADDALRLARIGYEAGLSDFLDLLDAERSALAAAQALVTARTELAAGHIRLYKALGGGFRETDPDARSTRP